MPVRTGVLSSSTPALDLYNLIAVDLAANPNWSRPGSNPTLTGATDAYSATSTAQIWKCTVGSQVFHVAFATDTALPNELRVTAFEAYDGSDGGGVPAAKKLRRQMGGGIATSGDNTSVLPGANDVVDNTDRALNTTSPNVAYTLLTLTGGAFSYLFKVGNKSVTIGVRTTANRWVHVGAFESLVTGPADTMPLGMFVHGVNNIVPTGASLSTTNHGDGVVSRNPGLGTTTEVGAFFACLAPLHDSHLAINGAATVSAESMQGYGNSPPRWFSKVLMSQAVIHQSRQATSGQAQTFRGYYPDLFAATVGSTVEPSGGGIDSVVIDGVTYYWLGMNCPGIGLVSLNAGHSILIAVRAT